MRSEGDVGLFVALVTFFSSGTHRGVMNDVEHFLHWLKVHECHRLYCEVTQEKRDWQQSTWVKVRGPFPSSEFIFLRVREMKEDEEFVRLKEETLGCSRTDPCRIVFYEEEFRIYK